MIVCVFGLSLMSCMGHSVIVLLTDAMQVGNCRVFIPLAVGFAEPLHYE